MIRGKIALVPLENARRPQWTLDAGDRDTAVGIDEIPTRAPEQFTAVESCTGLGLNIRTAQTRARQPEKDAVILPDRPQDAVLDIIEG